MQKKEVIIDQFIKTIKDSSADVSGDPVILSKVFDAIDKKKKRRTIIGVISLVSFIVVGLISTGIYFRSIELNQKFSNTGSTVKILSHTNTSAAVLSNIKILDEPVKEDLVVKTKPVKKEKKYTNLVTYKFSNHKIDVLKDNSDAFIQINVFGVDGAEKDFLQMVEELKNSYKSNELIVDSVKQK